MSIRRHFAGTLCGVWYWPKRCSQYAQQKAKDKELASEFDIEYQREVYRWAAQRVQADVDPKTWEAFRMTHVDGVAIVEAAKQLGVGVGQVYVARSRAPS
jgi:RNA polymerase sigma-70 factor (ECF subfamily)